MRRLRCCADLTPDPSHGVTNDVWMMFKDIHLKGEMLLWLVCFNIPVGPWHSDARWQATRAALADLLKQPDCRASPLYMSMAD